MVVYFAYELSVYDNVSVKGIFPVYDLRLGDDSYKESSFERCKINENVEHSCNPFLLRG